MKHNLKITFLILILFLSAQLIGLAITNNYLEKNLPYNIQRPQLEEKTSFVPVFVTILLVTLLVFLIIRLQARKLWMLWFFLSVFFCLTIAFSSFIQQTIALIIAFILALIKVLQRNVIIHNLTELFIYGGLAAIFVPILSLFSISILLVLISIYDMIAVWKTKHMIKLAKFQAKLKVFAGLLIPYEKNKAAILGGGDIGFPLLFAGVILKNNGWYNAITVALFVTFALFFLLIWSKKRRFYPAMPFLSAGCFIGYLISFL